MRVPCEPCSATSCSVRRPAPGRRARPGGVQLLTALTGSGSFVMGGRNSGLQAGLFALACPGCMAGHMSPLFFSCLCSLCLWPFGRDLSRRGLIINLDDKNLSWRFLC